MLAGVMGGCGTGNQVSKKKFQIKPGETAEFSVNRKTNGYGEKLDFETGAGEVARIPGRAVKRKFQYHVAGAPVDAE